MKSKQLKKKSGSSLLEVLRHFLLLGMLVLFSCEQENLQEDVDNSDQDNTAQQLILFDNFLHNVENAQYETYRENRAGSEEFSKMKAHVLNMYKDVKVTNSYEMEDGQTCDCITVLTQPSLRLQGPNSSLAPTPSFTPSSSAPTVSKKGSEVDVSNQEESPTLTVSLNDKYGNRRQCEQGSIPMIRLSLERMTQFSTLDAFFHKCQDPEGKGNCYLGEEFQSTRAVSRRYAYLNKSITNRGGNSWLNVWKPTTVSGNHNSISQQWYTAGSGGSRQTVEGGWLVNRNRTPRLFIYYTNANYSAGSGCYDLTCPGFVQVDNHWAMGRSFNTISQTNGSQYSFRMVWFKNGTNGPWWLWLEGYDKGAGRWIGYYPDELYGTGPMASNATRVLYGGEVTSNTATSRSEQMGSGRKAHEGWARAAYQRQVYYYNASGSALWFNSSSEIETDPSCYTIDRIDTTDPTWGTYFYFGGPSCY